MKKVKVLVVEDELVIALNICDILEELEYEVLEPVTNFDNALEAIDEEQPDIAILDIQLNGQKDGIELAEIINAKYNIPFIFLTSNSDKATLDKAKQTRPSSYLVKPFNQEDLFTAIEIALFNFGGQESQPKEEQDIFIKDSIFVKNKNMFYKVKIDEIAYLKSEHVYVELHTINGKKHLIRTSISSMIERLPDQFYRTHRSFAINLNYLDAINSMYVVVNKEEIPIGKTFRNDLLNIIQIE